MKIFDRDTFLQLSKKGGSPLISIYSPTSRQSNDGYKKDQIRFKNQLTEVEKKLSSEWNMDEREIAEILSPAEALLDDFEFWQHGSDLLAVFLAEGEIDYYKVPVIRENPMHFIGKKPLLTPLVPLLNDDGHYFLLLLNLDKIRLFEATRDVIQEVELDPEAVATSFTTEEEQDENITHIQGKGGVGTAGTMFHGHSGGSDEEKKNTVLNYFHRMTNMLEPILYKHPLPLYVAGVDYLIPLFKEASKYNHLREGYVSGAYTENDMMTLHKKSWEVAAEDFAAERKRRMEIFEAKKAEGLAFQDDNIAVIKAAMTGSVETLFVKRQHDHLWGTFDAAEYKVNINESKGKNDHCLMDLSAQNTVDSGGKVYLLDSDQMPGDGQLAAILRRPLA